MHHDAAAAAAEAAARLACRPPPPPGPDLVGGGWGEVGGRLGRELMAVTANGTWAPVSCCIYRLTALVLSSLRPRLSVCHTRKWVYTAGAGLKGWII
jgi:hypothetical protein